VSTLQGAAVETPAPAKQADALLALRGVARYFDVSPPWLDRVIER
jgi:hypothetical protein